jgi:hypothetical protein
VALTGDELALSAEVDVESVEGETLSVRVERVEKEGTSLEPLTSGDQIVK